MEQGMAHRKPSQRALRKVPCDAFGTISSYIRCKATKKPTVEINGKAVACNQYAVLYVIKTELCM